MVSRGRLLVSLVQGNDEKSLSSTSNKSVKEYHNELSTLCTLKKLNSLSEDDPQSNEGSYNKVTSTKSCVPEVTSLKEDNGTQESSYGGEEFYALNTSTTLDDKINNVDDQQIVCAALTDSNDIQADVLSDEQQPVNISITSSMLEDLNDERSLTQLENLDPLLDFTREEEIIVPQHDDIFHDTVNLEGSVNLNIIEIAINNQQTTVQSEELENVELIHTPNENRDAEDDISEGRPKKGRKRKIPDQSRADRKKRCITNQDYVNAKGNLVESRDFRDYLCNCKCYEQISREDRYKEFLNFWSLETFSSKCLFICNKVSKQPVMRKRVKDSTFRGFTRKYSLAGVNVCKQLFLQTLRISSCRVDKYLKKNQVLEPLKDKRGSCGGKNKISSDQENDIVEHIKKYPKYKSHYRREKTNEREYLTSDTTLSVMYNMYKEEYPNPVSMSKYKDVFYKRFNLHRKPLKKDTCNKCDSLTAQAASTTTAELKLELERIHKEHLNDGNRAQALMKADLESACQDDMLEVLTFDMEKTLPMPHIPTNIVFYKRQLWLYNCGIHSGKNKRGYCYIWIEGEAGRGAQEVGSCIRKHLKTHVSNKVKELILWSDSCGGQNRNLKILLLLKSVLEAHPHIEKITLRYLVPGHTYLPNDSEFGDIECALKLHNRLYTPEDYINVMEKARKRNKLVINRMNKEDFVSVTKLEQGTTYRKKDCSGNSVSWLNTREIVITKDKPFDIALSKIFGENPQILNIEKSGSRRSAKGRPPRVPLGPLNTESNQNGPIFKQELDLLWPQGKPISGPKLADLKSMLHLIPSDAKQFYNYLVQDNTIVDDIDGFDGPLDFDVELE